MKKSFFAIVVSSLLIFGFVGILMTNTDREVFADNCRTQDFSGVLRENELAIFNGEEIEVPSLAFNGRQDVLGHASEERWVEIDLSEQKITAWEGNKMFLQSLVSTGLSFTPTPPGEYRIWIKLRATKMEGGTGRNYYYLPNVPYVMFFGSDTLPNYLGYGLHGTYWHNDFGRPKSHGCVNLPTNIAELLFYWTEPQVPEGKWVVKSTAENPGTRVVVHE